MIIAGIGDFHLGCKAGSEVFNRYLMERFTRALIDISKQGITHVIIPGDFNDNRKVIYNVLLEFTQVELPKILKLKGLTLHILAGNHDVVYKNTNMATSLTMFNHVPNVHVYTSPQVVNIEGVDVLFVPWINASNQEKSFKMLEELHDEVSTVFGHFDIIEFKMYANSITSPHGINPKVFAKYKQVISNHYHHASTQYNISMLGSFAVLNRSDIPDTDKKGWYEIDLTAQTRPKLHKMPDSLYSGIVYDSSSMDTQTDLKLYYNTFLTLYVHDEPSNMSAYKAFVKHLKTQKFLGVNVNETFSRSKTDDSLTLDKVDESESTTFRTRLANSISLQVEDDQVSDVSALILDKFDDLTTSLSED